MADYPDLCWGVDSKAEPRHGFDVALSRSGAVDSHDYSSESFEFTGIHPALTFNELVILRNAIADNRGELIKMRWINGLNYSVYVMSETTKPNGTRFHSAVKMFGAEFIPVDGLFLLPNDGAFLMDNGGAVLIG